MASARHEYGMVCNFNYVLFQLATPVLRVIPCMLHLHSSMYEFWCSALCNTTQFIHIFWHLCPYPHVGLFRSCLHPTLCPACRSPWKLKRSFVATSALWRSSSTTPSLASTLPALAAATTSTPTPSMTSRTTTFHLRMSCVTLVPVPCSPRQSGERIVMSMPYCTVNMYIYYLVYPR